VRHAARPPPGRRRKRARPAGSAAPGSAAPGLSAPGSAPPGPAPRGRRRLQQLPYLLVLCGAGLSLLSMRQGEQGVRSGTLELAGVLLAAALARLLLPDRGAGLLGSRRRLADVAALAALGLGLLTAGLVFPVPA
jgi:hypothetical protein